MPLFVFIIFILFLNGGDNLIIKMNSDKSLLITIPTTIYRGEKNADLITFLVPMEYACHNMADCAAVMRYILPDGVGRSEGLNYDPLPYKNYLQFSTIADTRLTSNDGIVTLWLTFFNGNDEVVLKTGEVNVPISKNKNIYDYLPDEELDQLDQLVARIEYLDAMKADNLELNDRVLQLTSNGKLIGDAVHLTCGCDNSDDTGEPGPYASVVYYGAYTTDDETVVPGVDGFSTIDAIEDVFRFTIATENPMEYMYFFGPAALGTYKFQNINSPFPGGWQSLGSVDLTVNGEVKEYLAYKTDWDNLGEITWEVTII